MGFFCTCLWQENTEGKVLLVARRHYTCTWLSRKKARQSGFPIWRHGIRARWRCTVWESRCTVKLFSSQVQNFIAMCMRVTSALLLPDSSAVWEGGRSDVDPVIITRHFHFWWRQEGEGQNNSQSQSAVAETQMVDRLVMPQTHSLFLCLYITSTIVAFRIPFKKKWPITNHFSVLTATGNVL